MKRSAYAVVASMMVCISSANAFQSEMNSCNGHAAMIKNGFVFTTGNNYGGQMGPNVALYGQSIEPVLAGLDNVTTVATGGLATVAIKNDGTVWFQGMNMVTREKIVDAIELYDLYGASDVGVNRDGVYAIINGTVWFWDFNVTTQVSGIPDSAAVELDAQLNNVLVATIDGSVYAIGLNTYGQLGDGSYADTSPYDAVQVIDENGDPLTGVRQVRQGRTYSVANTFDGRVFVWGQNRYGTLAEGTYDDYSYPHPVDSGASNVVKIHGGLGILALQGNGTLLGWGWHNHISANTNNRNFEPTVLESGIESLDGSYEEAFVKVNGAWYAWGGNQAGKLFVGHQTELHNPELTLELVTPEPDRSIETDPSSEGNEEECRPGNGHGDTNHCHSGPPGQNKK